VQARRLVRGGARAGCAFARHDRARSDPGVTLDGEPRRSGCAPNF